MRKLLSFLTLLTLPILFLQGGLATSGCGSAGVDLDSTEDSSEDQSSTTDCADTEESVSSTNVTANITGDACQAPSPAVLSEDRLTLDCGDRDTTDDMPDFTTVACGSSAATERVYYCEGGIVFRDNGDDDVTLFEILDLTCTANDDGTGEFTEAELIIG